MLVEIFDDDNIPHLLIGILVISARRGEFETGFEKGGQTREHALLAKTLGVRFLIVVINKMDDSTVNWEQERFDECVNKLKPFLKNCGYAIKRDVRFIPISGLTGANVLNEVSPSICPWWAELCASGANNTSIPTVIGTLDAFAITDRSPDGPLRIPVLDRYIERGLVVMGKVESGTLRVKDEVAILPTRRKAVVEGIYSGEVKLRFALPGENVLIKFNLNMEDVQKGYVLSSLAKSCPTVREFVVQLALVDMVEHRPVFTSGYDCVMHLHTAEIEVTCVQLLTVTDKKGLETTRRFAKQGEMCTARFSTPLTVCMETFANMPALGRITLRDEGKTIAIGKVIKLYKPKA
jgi:peptide chain release factor subunit 3